MHLPDLYTAASGARFGGISIGTLKKRIVALGIQPVASLAFGRTLQPLYSAPDVMKIVAPYVVARDLHRSPDVAAKIAPTKLREEMKADQETGAYEVVASRRFDKPSAK